jgi:hypothetical protein
MPQKALGVGHFNQSVIPKSFWGTLIKMPVKVLEALLLQCL